MSLKNYTFNVFTYLFYSIIFFGFCRGIFLSITNYTDVKSILLGILYFSSISIINFLNPYLIVSFLLFGTIFILITYYYTKLKNYYFFLIYFISVYIILFLKEFIAFLNKEINTVDYEDFYVPLICLLPTTLFCYYLLRKDLWKETNN